MLDPRAQHLLKTLVERYIAEGQPVGSRALSRHSGLELSPATIRNVMADLEEMGLIASPHTSAGRVPTPRGYRFFVDSLMVDEAARATTEIHRLEGELNVDQPQQLVSAAASLLSQLTQFAGVVATPKRREAVFRHLEFLRLSERRVLLIIVTPDGDVQNRILHTDRVVLADAADRGDQLLQPEFRRPVARAMRERLRRRAARTARRHRRADEGRGRRGRGRARRRRGAGRHRRAQPAACGRPRVEHGAAAAAVRPVRAEDLAAAPARRVAARAGRADLHRRRVGLVPLDECSVVTAPYEVNGQVVGTLGVIGPTRMAYERVIPIVDITAKLLSNALSRELADD